ncbi:MAG: hypothetical protein AAF550_02460, partial [Myxococcota bacterium]
SGLHHRLKVLWAFLDRSRLASLTVTHKVLPRTKLHASEESPEYFQAVVEAARGLGYEPEVP